MKRFLLILFFLVILAPVKSQVVFCPPGAEWHHNFFTIFVSFTENQMIKYVGDTIWGPDTLKILSPGHFFVNENCRRVSRTLIKQKGDTIFMNNNHTQNQWQILYNYAAQPGQSWQTNHINSFNAPVTVSVTVDSVSNVFFNGFSLRRLFVKYVSSQSCYKGGLGHAAYITERFGCTPYVYFYCGGHCTSDGDVLSDFLCYSDNNFGTYQFTNKPCDFVNYSGVAERIGDLTFQIHPNPIKDLLTIETNTEEETEIEFSDLSGRKVKQLRFKQTEKIDLSDLEKGIYFIRISKNNGTLYTSKLIKE